jgi:pimeloyl-ACP methyl ester carboxylesterase
MGRETTGMAEFSAGAVAGWVTGEGPPLLLLHGGPGLSYEYLHSLTGELEGFRAAAFQQRGLAPSTTDGPFDIPTAVADVVAVLDALGWERAWVAGHSWGGHLLAHVLVAVPERVLGALAIDPLGAAGDGGMAAFEAEMTARTPAADRARAQALDERAMSGEGTAEDGVESLRLYWPAYFASPPDAPPMPPVRLSVAAYSQLLTAALEALPRLEAALPGVRVPLGCLAGERSPMPLEEAAAATARLVPGAWLQGVPGAGHFPWLERPGCVRAALQRLTR